MAKRRGNTTDYAARAASEADVDYEKLLNETRTSGRNIPSAYDRASGVFPPRVTASEIIDALDALAAAFGDVAFGEAAIVLRSYDFEEGALKARVSDILSVFRERSIEVAADLADEFVQDGASALEAAKQAVAITGAQGAKGGTFSSAVDEVRKACRAKRQRKDAHAARWPNGDTGRKYKIEWRGEINRASGTVWAKMPPGAEQIGDNLFVVPDDRLWRRAIKDGFGIVICTL